jgi:hypothetical protein
VPTHRSLGADPSLVGSRHNGLNLNGLNLNGLNLNGLNLNGLNEGLAERDEQGIDATDLIAELRTTQYHAYYRYHPTKTLVVYPRHLEYPARARAVPSLEQQVC